MISTTILCSTTNLGQVSWNHIHLTVDLVNTAAVVVAMMLRGANLLVIGTAPTAGRGLLGRDGVGNVLPV